MVQFFDLVLSIFSLTPEPVLGVFQHVPQVETLQQQVISLQEEAKLLRSQLLIVTQEKLGHTQEVTELRRKLREADGKVRSPAADRFWVLRCVGGSDSQSSAGGEAGG